jgi:hypothetical protein
MILPSDRSSIAGAKFGSMLAMAPPRQGRAPSCLLAVWEDDVAAAGSVAGG